MKHTEGQIIKTKNTQRVKLSKIKTHRGSNYQKLKHTEGQIIKNENTQVKLSKMKTQRVKITKNENTGRGKMGEGAIHSEYAQQGEKGK